MIFIKFVVESYCMNYYLVNYSISAENLRIALPLATAPDVHSLKLQIALIRNTISAEAVEIVDYKQVTEDVFNLISPFINSDLQEDKSVN